jgi:DNA-binding beta-propeller fold protein YncE
MYAHRAHSRGGRALRLLTRPIFFDDTPKPASNDIMMIRSLHFEIDAKSVQRIVPPNPSERFEGIDFSRSGNIIAIATSETNSVLLFKRKPDGRFEDAPFQIIGRSPSGLDYPHDVSFSRSEDAELLAVAQRAGAVAIYEKNGPDESYGSKPAFEISGPRSKLAYSDGVSFVPPTNDYLAACNLELGTILFFRRISRSPLAFDETPEFELKHPSIFHPDGLGFSYCGRWLAIANHGNGSVSIFQRQNRILSGGKPKYGPEPVTLIQDPQFRYPHSVAFTPQTNHLVVTNAGANYFNVYEPRRDYFGMRWSRLPVAQVIVHDDEVFREVNTANKMEGGPKGVAIYESNLAVCSPQVGVKVYSLRERRGWLPQIGAKVRLPSKVAK